MPRTMQARHVQPKRSRDESDSEDEEISPSNITQGKRQRRAPTVYWDLEGEVQACTREGLQSRDFHEACESSDGGSIYDESSEDEEVKRGRTHLLRQQSQAPPDDAQYWEESGAEDEYAPAPIRVKPVYEDDEAFFSSQEQEFADPVEQETEDEAPTQRYY